MNLKKSIGIFGIITFLFLGCICLNAQTTATEKTVYGFFSKPKKIQWLEHYKGQIDGVNDIAITLAYDGKSCKGLMVYLKSRERFRLDGELNGNELMLLEVDQNAAITGQLEGYIEGKNIHLNWSNIDNTLGSDVFLTHLQNEEFSTKSFGDNNWVREYQGLVFGNKVFLYLQKSNQSTIKGTAYFENENKSYNVQGDIFDFDNVNILIKDDSNILKGTIEGAFNDVNSISANFYNKEGQRSPSIFSIEKSLKIKSKAYADYVTTYDIAYPKSRQASFNRWMEKLTNQWVKECKDHSFEVRKVSAKPNPEMRSSIRAYAWSDVDYFDEKLISGFLTFENTWTNGLNGKPFNFDFKKGKEISFEDLFKEGFDRSAIIAKYLNEEISQHELYNDYGFRKWLSNQEFPYFLIHKDGIAFCTTFDSVYGKQKVKIPYEKLKPYFKENNVLSYLIESNGENKLETPNY